MPALAMYIIIWYSELSDVECLLESSVNTESSAKQTNFFKDS